MADEDDYSNLGKEEWYRKLNLANQHLQLPFHGASYCGKERIEEIDYSEILLVIKVGGDPVGWSFGDYLHTLPMWHDGSYAWDKNSMLSSLPRFRGVIYAPQARIHLVALGPIAARALNMSDVDKLFGTNYLVVDSTHRGAPSAVERLCEHGKAFAVAKRKKATD